MGLGTIIRRHLRDTTTSLTRYALPGSLVAEYGTVLLVAAAKT